MSSKIPNLTLILNLTLVSTFKDEGYKSLLKKLIFLSFSYWIYPYFQKVQL